MSRIKGMFLNIYTHRRQKPNKKIAARAVWLASNWGMPLRKPDKIIIVFHVRGRSCPSDQNSRNFWGLKKMEFACIE